MAYFFQFYPLVTLKILFLWLIPIDYYENNQCTYFQREFPYKTHLMIITLKICNKLQFFLFFAYFPHFYPLVTLKIRFWWLIPMDYYKNNQRSSLQRDLADKHHDIRLQILKIGQKWRFLRNYCPFLAICYPRLTKKKCFFYIFEHRIILYNRIYYHYAKVWCPNFVFRNTSIFRFPMFSYIFPPVTV